MEITIGILIVCIAIYICNFVMLNRTLDELKEIKQCLQTMRSYMRNWR